MGTHRLFVYGSLRPLGGAFDRLLADAAVSVHEAELEDHALYGWGLPYPFVAPEAGSRVVGSVVEIDPRRLEEVLAAIDEYEGGEYRRVEVDVDLTGQRVRTFVYVAGADVELSEDNKVQSGDWMAPS